MFWIRILIMLILLMKLRIWIQSPEYLLLFSHHILGFFKWSALLTIAGENYRYQVYCCWIRNRVRQILINRMLIFKNLDPKHWCKALRLWTGLRLSRSKYVLHCTMIFFIEFLSIESCCKIITWRCNDNPGCEKK